MSGDPAGSRDLHPRDEPDALQPDDDQPEDGAGQDDGGDDNDDGVDNDDGRDGGSAGPPDSDTSAGAPTRADTPD